MPCKIILFLSLCLLSSAGMAASSTPPGADEQDALPAPEASTEIVDKGDITLVFSAASGTAGQDIASQTEDSAGLLSAINNSIRLPAELPIYFKDCAAPQAQFNTETSQVELCYAAIDAYATAQTGVTATRREWLDAAQKAVHYLLIRETGNALYLRVTLGDGQKSSLSALEMAALLLLSLEENSVKEIKQQWVEFLLAAKQKASAFKVVESPLELNSINNLLCLFYGSDPKSFTHLVGTTKLTQERAATCEYEFSQKMNDWTSLLTPYLKLANPSPDAAQVWQ